MSEIPEDIRGAAERLLRDAWHAATPAAAVDVVAEALLAVRLAQIERDAGMLEAKAREMRGSVTGNAMAMIFNDMAARIRNQEQKP